MRRRGCLVIGRRAREGVVHGFGRVVGVVHAVVALTGVEGSQGYDHWNRLSDLSARVEKAYWPRAYGSAHGVLAGKHLGPRAVAILAHTAGFRDDELFTAVQVCGAESWMFTRAYNDNIDDQTGQVVSRDVGLWEINIPASLIGSSAEEALYDPQTNANRAFTMWRNRGWQPWAAYTSGVYLHDTYTLWGLLGVMNRLGEINHTFQLAAGYSSKVKVPAVSIPTARTLWPGVPLG